MKVLVLGGQGYIGSALVPLLVAQGHDVKSIDLCWHAPAITENRELDVGQLQWWSVNYDAIVALAGHSSVTMSRGYPYAAIKNNVANVLHVLELLRADQRLIYFSSGSVYGRAGISKEFVALNQPINEYDASKRAIDGIMQAQQRHQNWVGFRCATVCGGARHVRTDTMANAMYLSARDKGFVMLYDDVRRPLISVSDVARAVVWTLESGKGQGIYNLAAFNTRTAAVAATVAEFMDVPVIQGGNPGTPYDFELDTTKFLRDTGFECQDDLPRIIHSLKNPEIGHWTDRQRPWAYP